MGNLRLGKIRYSGKNIQLWEQYKSTIIRLEDIEFEEERECAKCGNRCYWFSRYFDVVKIRKTSFRTSNNKENVICIIKTIAKFNYGCPCKKSLNGKRELYAAYSITDGKFILSFEFGYLNAEAPFIIAYRNKEMGIFSFCGDSIIPMTKNIFIDFVYSMDPKKEFYYYFLKIAKLQDNWFEIGRKETPITHHGMIHPHEEYKVLVNYNEKNNVPMGVYSYLENRLIVPIKFSDVVGTSKNTKGNKVYLITNDGYFSHGVYSEEGKCIIAIGKYGTIYFTNKYIVARKHMQTGGYNDYYTEEASFGPNCGQVENYYVHHEGCYTCTSCVDLYSHEGKLLKENVFLSKKTRSIENLDSLEDACHESEVDKMEI